MLRLRDYASFANGRLLRELEVEINNSGNSIDFSGVEIMGGSHSDIADFIITHNIQVIGIQKKDAEKIDTCILKLKEPKVDNFQTYIEVFKKRFRKGSIAVLDETMNKKRKAGDNPLSIIMIESIYEDGIAIRKYHSSKVTPEKFKQESKNGGKDSPNLFIRTHFKFVELFNNEKFIRHPAPNEKPIIDLLFK